MARSRAFSIAAVLFLAFAALAVLVGHRTPAFDPGILRALRHAGNPAVPVGPGWAEDAAFDLTALGSDSVLTIVLLVSAGFLLLRAQRSAALALLITAATGEALDQLLKALFDRARPTVVPHLRMVSDPSFPSGHAMDSAVVYLTLALLMAGAVSWPGVRRYGYFIAATLTLLVGATRLYLGVHYPTDVLAGWLIGAAWAFFCYGLSPARVR